MKIFKTIFFSILCSIGFGIAVLALIGMFKNYSIPLIIFGTLTGVGSFLCVFTEED